MAHLNMPELFEFLPNLTNVLSDRPKVGRRRTARSSARLRYSEESEVVSAGGQRVAIRIGQIGVEEEASDILPAELPDSKQLSGGLVLIHAVHGDERPLEGAQGIVTRHPVEDLRQIGAAVDVGMERIALPAAGGVSAARGHRHLARGGIEQVERQRRDIADLEGAIGRGVAADLVDDHGSSFGEVVLGRRGDPDRRGVADAVNGVVELQSSSARNQEPFLMRRFEQRPHFG